MKYRIVKRTYNISSIDRAEAYFIQSKVGFGVDWCDAMPVLNPITGNLICPRFTSVELAKDKLKYFDGSVSKDEVVAI